MGWDKDGRYYTRSRRENGRVVREYVGGGLVGKYASQLDAIERDKRLTERECERIRRQDYEVRDRELEHLEELADLVVRAVLASAGFHQHHRGEWRKRRGRRETD